MQNLDKTGFLTKLFALYPPECNSDDKFSFYSDVLSSDEEYDYNELMRIVGREFKYKYTPSTSWLIEQRERCRIEKKIENETPVNEGEVIIMKLPSGMMYSFTVTGYGKHLTEIEGRLKGQYGECVVTRHPKGTTLIGTRIFEPDGEVVQE